MVIASWPLEGWTKRHGLLSRQSEPDADADGGLHDVCTVTPLLSLRERRVIRLFLDDPTKADALANIMEHAGAKDGGNK